MAPRKNLAHYRTLQALPLVLGAAREADADYLDACRSKRNTAEYDAAGTISQVEAVELRHFTAQLKDAVLTFIRTHQPHLLP